MQEESSKSHPPVVNSETVCEPSDEPFTGGPSSSVPKISRSESAGEGVKHNSTTEILVDGSGASSDPTLAVASPNDSDRSPEESDDYFPKWGNRGNQAGASLVVANKTFRPFNERYWIGEQIGTGGMGLVHLGWDLNLQRHVAIKLIRDDRKVDKQVLHRFLREARIASRLRHPGILGIHDFSIESSGLGYIIMDLITGKTMEQLFANLSGGIFCSC